MANGRPDGTLIEVRAIALYPNRISSLAGRTGVRFRQRKKRESTLVPCRITTAEGRSVATPEYPIPEGTPPPRYRAQVEMVRAAVDDRRVVHVVLSAEPETSKIDPERLLLSPIFDDGHRMIFEFQRGQVFSVTRRGDVETRLVAVHPALGFVGTKTIHRFNTRLCGLALRCTEHLAGAIDLFPPREHPARMYRVRIPEGEANLAFDCGTRPFGPRGFAQPEPDGAAMELWGKSIATSLGER